MTRSSIWLLQVVLVTASTSYAQQRQPLQFPHQNDGLATVDQHDPVVPDGVTETKLFQLESPINGLAVSADGRYLAAVSQSGTLAIWDFETGDMRSKNRHPDGPLHAVEFHAEKNIVAYGGDGAVLRVWNLETDFHQTMEGAKSGTTAIAIVHEGVVAGGADGTIRFFPPGRDQGIVMRKQHRKKVVHLASAQLRGTRKMPVGCTLVVSVDESGLMRLWNNGQHVARKTSGAAGIKYAKFVSGNAGRLFFSTEATRRGNWLDVKLQDNYGKVLHKIPVLENRRVSVNNSVQIRKVWTTKKFCKTEYVGTTTVLQERPAEVGYDLGEVLTLNRAGSRLASTGPRSIDIWSLQDESPELSRRLYWDSDDVVKSMVWTSDSSGLITGSESGAVQLHRD